MHHPSLQSRADGRKLRAESQTTMWPTRPALTGVESCCSNSRHHPPRRWSIKLEFSPLAQLRLICEEMPNPLDLTGSTILDKTPSSWRAIRLDKLHIDSSANSAVRIQPVLRLATLGRSSEARRMRPVARLEVSALLMMSNSCSRIADALAVVPSNKHICGTAADQSRLSA